jgi:hypothetical protein
MNLVALVLLQMLIVNHRIASLRAGVDAVEDLRLLVQIVAVGLEVLVPVGELDDHLHLGIDGPRRAHHQVARHLVHQPQPEGGPTGIALGGDVGVRLGVVKEEIVEDDLVEVPRRHFGDVLHIGAILGVGIGK